MTKFDAKELLQLGIRLVSYEPNEAGYRTAINRAYYACHLIGCETTSKKGWFTRKGSAPDHSGLWGALREKGRTNWWSKLESLYRLREHADYHIDPKQHPDCSYCSSKADTTILADEAAWVKAEALANDILPRLQSIMPRS